MAFNMKIKAYSYIRFSTEEQAKGSSLTRQAALSEKYADENNLDLDTTLNMKDLGISAYRGDNITHGALGSFIEAINTNKVEKGSYLLVESLDRLSRKKVVDALAQFINILNAGITIVTLSDNKKYDLETLNETDLIISLTIMSRAHEESKIKGQRVTAAWKTKKDNIATKKLTKWAPKWLYLSDDMTKFYVHEDRNEIINNIFEWSASGLGITLIIQKLETLGIQPWSSIKANEPIRKVPKRWHASYIQRVLSDRTVLGEYKMRSNEVANGYTVIKDYYPRVVSDELFYSVQAARTSRNVRLTGKGAGRKGKYISNIFSGLAYCGYSLDDNIGNHRCSGTNERMLYTNKGKHLTYIQCSRQKSGNSGCSECRKMWRYKSFETSFLTHINNIDISTLMGSKNEQKEKIDSLKVNINVASGRISEIDAELKKLANAIDEFDDIPEFIIQRGIELESDRKDLNTNLAELEVELSNLISTKTSELDVQKQLKQLIPLIEEKQDNELFNLRLQLSEIIKSTIDEIHIYSNGRLINYKKIEDELGKDAVNLIRQNESQIPNLTLAIFDVYYKSGQRRTVLTDRKNPSKILTILDFDNTKLTKAILSVSGQLKKQEFN